MKAKRIPFNSPAPYPTESPIGQHKTKSLPVNKKVKVHIQQRPVTPFVKAPKTP